MESGGGVLLDDEAERAAANCSAAARLGRPVEVAFLVILRQTHAGPSFLRGLAMTALVHSAGDTFRPAAVAALARPLLLGAVQTLPQSVHQIDDGRLLVLAPLGD